MGLIRYDTDRSDVYGYKNQQGQIEFILRCTKIKEKVNRRFSCSSVDQNVFPNLIYNYHYNREYLPHAVEIDRKVKEMIKEMTKEQP